MERAFSAESIFQNTRGGGWFLVLLFPGVQPELLLKTNGVYVSLTERVMGRGSWG